MKKKVINNRRRSKIKKLDELYFIENKDLILMVKARTNMFSLITCKDLMKGTIK